MSVAGILDTGDVVVVLATSVNEAITGAAEVAILAAFALPRLIKPRSKWEIGAAAFEVFEEGLK